MKPLHLALAAAAFAATTAQAAVTEPGNFDEFLSAVTKQSLAAPANLGGRLPAQFDAQLGRVTFLWADAGTQPAAVGALQESALLEARARAYLLERAAALHLSPDEIAAAQVTDAQYNGAGPAVVRFKQRVDGHEVFNRSLNVMLDRAGRAVAVSGYFADGYAEAQARPPAFLLGAPQAIAAAVRNLGIGDLGAILPSLLEQRGAYTLWSMPTLADNFAFDRAPRAKAVLYPRGDRLEAGWYVELFASDYAQNLACSFVISALDGSLLFRKNLKASYTYRVFADAGGINQPYDSPLGNGFEPFPAADYAATFPRVDAGSQLVTLDHAPMISTGDPWLAPDAIDTNGNNVDAYTDTQLPNGYRPNVPGTAPVFGNGADLRPTTTSPGVFDYPLAADMDPTTRDGKAAAVVTLFYINNWLHDLYYDHGFNEAAGAGQQDNYGRGGLDGDPVQAQGQDWSGRNNANMATPADGSSPTQQMYLFTSPDSGITSSLPVGGASAGDYDGTLDPLIIAHENFHYVSNRLVGDGGGLNNNQGGSMGEGWGDVASLLIAVRGEDRAAPGNARYQGSYSVGVYVDPSFYYSVRRQPYSTDFAKNSFTFRHISQGEPAPEGAPIQGGGAGSSEVHASGEIWANMLWECWAGLINDPRHSFAQARSNFIDYEIAGLKMTPSSPTFTEARDGVLAAALASDAQDFAECGHGFARRGIGMGAVAPERNSTNHAGVVESYDDFTPKSGVIAASAAAPGRFGGALGWLLLLPLLGASILRRRPTRI